MKLFFSFCLFLSTLSFTYSQTITIRDAATGEPLPLATLSSENPKAFATTDLQGQADISALKGASRIEIRLLGYETLIKSFSELQAASFALTMKTNNLSLNEVVVSGTRWRQNTSDVPSKIISISSKEVSLLNPQTAADLLGISGKVFIQKSQQGGGSPMIRGFATNRLLYAVDGVRMNTAIFRSGNLQNVINIDPFAVESTEVLFGPGSVIYGSDAVGGVMSFQTLIPRFSLTEDPLVTGKAITRYSSANKEKTGHFDVNVGWKKWAFVTSLTSWDYDHLRQGSHGPEDYLKPYYVQRQDSIDRVVTQDDPLLQIPSAYTQLNLMQKFRFKPNDEWDFQYGFHYSESSPYGRYDRHNRLRDGAPRYAEWNYGPQIWMMNTLGLTHSEKSLMYDEANIRLAYQHFEESRIDRSFTSNERNTQTETVGAYSANADLKKALGTKHTLFYGVESVYDEVTSTGLLTDITTGQESPGPSRYPASTWQSLGVYVNDEFKVSDRLTLQAGARYNHFILDATFDTTFYDFPFTEAHISNGALTGSFGGVFRPTESWAISANLGTAFRSPNIDDLGKVFDSEPGSVVVPNPNLEAEYAYNADFGLAKVFGNAVKVDVTAYYTSLKNAMVRRDYQLNGQDSIIYQGEMSKVQAIQNAAVANVYGIQAGLEIRLPAGFGFASDFNYQVGEEELDDGSSSPSRHAAPWFGVSRLTFATDRLDLQFNIEYSGTREFEDLAMEERGKTEFYALDENGNPYSPGWYTLNLKAMYQLTDYLKVNTGVENLSDQRYRPYSSGISRAGRNFVLSLTAVF